MFTPEALFAITDRLFLESKRQEDRDRAAASSGAVEGYAYVCVSFMYVRVGVWHR
jgi:hypothetical protein